MLLMKLLLLSIWLVMVTFENDGVALDVDIHVVAVEQCGDLAADIGLELGLGVGRGLRLPGKDHARRILGDGLQHLSGKEHDRGFDDRKQQREEHRRDQGEFDGGRTPAVAAKSTQ